MRHLEATGVYDDITVAAVESFQAKIVDTLKALNQIKPISDIDSFFNLMVTDVSPCTGKLDKLTSWCLDYYYNTSLQISILPAQEDTKEDTKEEEETGIATKNTEDTKEETEVEEPALVRLKALEVAISQIGVVERGNNYGKQVQEYQMIGSNGEVSGGAPWCQYFQNWCVIQAAKELGIEIKIIYDGYTPNWINWGKKKEITIINPSSDDIEPGDFGYVYSASRGNACHVFMIEEILNNGIVKTIEGNTNPGGGSDGYGVFRRVRTKPWAIVKWSRLYA